MGVCSRIINCLLNWFPFLRSYTAKEIKKEIPFEISDDELLVRAIGHYMFFSINDKELKREAFLPPANRADVSLLRRKYTTDEFCKKHAKSINMKGYIYCGLATFLFSEVAKINALPHVKVRPKVVGSPIDENGQYITQPPVFENAVGIPMHADIIYPEPVQKGKVMTEYRQFAQEMLKGRVTFLEDPNPAEEVWSGDPLLKIA